MKQGRPADDFFHRSFCLPPEKRSFFAFFPVVLFFFALLRGYFFRDLWFDEALTIINFALKESPLAIYNSYFIPNNQIIHTILIHIWLRLSGFALLRLPALLCALAVLALLWQCRRRFGRGVMCVVLSALAVSVPFLNYGTAVRGYMLSSLFVLLALRAVSRAMYKAGSVEFVKFFIFSFLAVGTMPGTLAALTAAVLYAIPFAGSKFYLKKRFYLSAAIPPAALILFYLPIAKKLFAAVKLGEGWHSSSAALTAVYSGIFYAFAVLIIPSLCTMALLLKRLSGRKAVFFLRGVIWLLPAGAVMILPVSPFPRVFFPMFPIFTLLLASGLTHLRSMVFLKWKRKGVAVFTALMFVLAAVYGFAAQSAVLRAKLSFLCSGAGDDDYIYSHYLRSDFRPAETGAFLVEKFPEVLPPVFISLPADPWALLFVLIEKGYSPYHFYFDGPRGRVGNLPSGALLIIRRSENVSDYEKRFGMKAERLFESAMHGVYVLK